MTSPNIPTSSSPISSFGSSDPFELLSPSGETHPCRGERLFPEPDDRDDIAPSNSEDFDENDEDEEDPMLLLQKNIRKSPTKSVRSEASDIEERLRHASMTGSIHELQCGDNTDKESLSLPPSMTTSLKEPSNLDELKEENDEEEEEEDEEFFQDAKEEQSPDHEIKLRQLSLDEKNKSQDDNETESFVNSEEWRAKRKHIFILSEAGKPIFSLHGDEDQLASVVAVMQAMVSYVTDMKDSLRSMEVDGKLIVFMVKGPLIFVAVSREMECETQLTVQLTYFYNQLLSVLTLSQIVRIFEERKGFDLRRMIAGSERLLYSLSDALDQDPCFMLSAVRVLPMPSQARDLISNSIIQACSKIQNVVFAILLAENQLITLVRMKKYFIHPADLHLIFNLVNSTESFKDSEAWIPICLPKFDSSGFMQAHVSYLTQHTSACLILLTVERDIFFQLSEAKKKIELSLEKHRSAQAITEGLKQGRYLPQKTLGVQQIRHFLYKAKTAAQFTAPEWQVPYMDRENRARVQGIYLQIQNRLHSYNRPLKLMYFGGKYENVLGWVTQSFELYATFSPMTSKALAIESINKLLRWSKKEENSLFILNAPTF